MSLLVLPGGAPCWRLEPRRFRKPDLAQLAQLRARTCIIPEEFGVGGRKSSLQQAVRAEAFGQGELQGGQDAGLLGGGPGHPTEG